MPKEEIEKKQLDLIEIKFNHDLQRHKMRMQELEFARETERINHENGMTRMRIKSAEIRKAQDRRHSR